jgi:hypothetical protein
VLVVAVALAAAACSRNSGNRGIGPSPSSPSGPPALTIRPVPANIPVYDRDDWNHWIDADGDCQDTRAEVLVEESRVPVLFRDMRTCVADSGRWDDPYTGQSLVIAGSLDIDHLVPLANAHRSGAWTWTPDQKERFANDLSYPLHLIAVMAAANRAKGAKGPEEWRPANAAFWCQYATAWIQVKQTWNLTATAGEWNALQELLDTCP